MAMRFLSMVRINEKSGLMPSEKLMQDMGKLMDEMTREGTLVTTAGLRPTAEGKRVRQRHGKQSVTDGPFTEAKTLSRRNSVELDEAPLQYVVGDETIGPDDGCPIDAHAAIRRAGATMASVVFTAFSQVDGSSIPLLPRRARKVPTVGRVPFAGRIQPIVTEHARVETDSHGDHPRL